MIFQVILLWNDIFSNFWTTTLYLGVDVNKTTDISECGNGICFILVFFPHTYVHVL